MVAGGFDQAAARWIPAVNGMDSADSDRCWAMLALAAPNIAFKITTIAPAGLAAFEDHARRFLAHSALEAIEWINITRGVAQFKTLFDRKI